MFFVYDVVDVNATLGHACSPLYQAVRVGRMCKDKARAVAKARRTSCNAYVCDGSRNVVFDQLGDVI